MVNCAPQIISTNKATEQIIMPPRIKVGESAVSECKILPTVIELK